MSDSVKEKYKQQMRDAVVAIRKLKAELAKERDRNREAVAVIGMAMRLPGGVRDADSYWQLLTEGRDAIVDIPKERFNIDDIYDAEMGQPGKTYVRQGGFIEDVDQFDGSFFDISPVELESMDPQQRLLLELSHEAMEDAGLNVLEEMGSNTGVYIGMGSDDYQKLHFHSGDYDLVGPYTYTGSMGNAMAGRISYTMGFQGPSMSIDTACSASVIAAHVGSKALRNGECDMALVGGVNLMLSPEMTIVFSGLQALSPDARCKAFDSSANGYVRSEGCGVLVLKRLSDAQRDKDRIHAVIHGSASNQDGRSNGFTAPNVSAQIALIEKALKDAGLEPGDIDYIEAHGTGTKLGDPIEMEALTTVFGQHKNNEDPLFVGSVKSNIGHLESAAGMAGMIKAILSLKHQEIPPSIHYNTPNPLIPWDRIPVVVPTEVTSPKDGLSYIGTSGFGITGTNGHIVLGAAPEKNAVQHFPTQTTNLFLPLSARSEAALKDLAGTYADFLETTSADVVTVCSMVAHHRAHFDQRHCFTAKSKDGLIEQLRHFAEHGSTASLKTDSGDQLRKVFVFSGQGAQWAQMTVELSNDYPEIKEYLSECNEALNRYVEWDVFEELEKGEEDNRLKEGTVMQPLLMAVGIALARWWMNRGVTPDVVLGHSMGEVAAAYIGGHISLDDAARIITSRSSLMEQQAGKGAMLATDLTAQEAAERIKPWSDQLSVAVVNSPSLTVVGGVPGALEELSSSLESDDRWSKRVRMTVAAHTAQMDPVLEPLKASLSEIKPIDGTIPFFSVCQNKPKRGHELDADYWVSNVRNTVRFTEAIAQVAEDQTIFIEIGPHAVLSTAIEETVMALPEAKSFTVIPSLLRKKEEAATINQHLGRAYDAGLDLDWSEIWVEPYPFVDLPKYSWQKQRYWFDQKPKFQVQPKVSEQEEISLFKYSWKQLEKPSLADDERPVLLVGSFQRSMGYLSEHVVTAQIDDLDEYFAKGDSVLIYRPQPELSQAALDLQAVCLAADVSPHEHRIVIWTDNALASKADPAAEQALLWGMARTIRNEYPELSILSVEDDGSDLELFRTLVWSEALQNHEVRIKDASITYPKIVPYSGDAASPNGLKDAVFLVTGGTSGLGLACAEWLAEQGVKGLALVSRSGEKPETEGVLKRIRSLGVQAQVFQADVSDAESLRDALMEIQEQMGIVTGFVHAAGVLDDATLANITPEQIQKITASKITGALTLHEAGQSLNLDHFVVFSSAATVLGTLGQSIYNGANFFMDQLMGHRRQLGMPATSMSWGNIGGVGMAAAQENRGNRFESMGFGVIEPDELPIYFEEMFRTNDAHIVAMKLDFRRWVESYPLAGKDPMFADFFQQEITIPEPAKDAGWGATAAETIRKLQALVTTSLAEIIRMPKADIQTEDTFKSMGLDSMLALQLRNKLQEAISADLPVSSIWAHPNVEKYSQFLLTKIELSNQEELESSSVSHTDHSLRKLVAEQVAAVTRLAPDAINEQETFKSMGVDSMLALQIRNHIQKALDISLPVSSIWAHPTIEKYSAFLMSELTTDTTEQVEEEVSEVNEANDKPVDDLSLDDLLRELEDKTNKY